MIIVVVIALAMTALRSGTATSLIAFYYVTILALLLSVIASRACPVPQGLFWFGFAVLGWGYFLISVNGYEGGTLAKTCGGKLTFLSTSPELPTTQLFESLWENFIKDTSGFEAVENSTDESNFGRQYLALQQSAEAFVGIAHLIFVWVLGFIGGGVAVLMRADKGERTGEPN